MVCIPNWFFPYIFLFKILGALLMKRREKGAPPKHVLVTSKCWWFLFSLFSLIKFRHSNSRPSTRAYQNRSPNRNTALEEGCGWTAHVECKGSCILSEGPHGSESENRYREQQVKNPLYPLPEFVFKNKSTMCTFRIKTENFIPVKKIYLHL